MNASTSLCEWPGATLPVMRIARWRLAWLMICSAGCSVRVDHASTAGPASPVGRADAEQLEVLGARALGREQAHPDVHAAAGGRVLADHVPPIERADGGGDVVDVDVDVGGARPVGRDRELGRAEVVVAVEVDGEAGLVELTLDLLRQRDQRGPVAAAHGELDRLAASAGEALLRQVLDRGAHPGDLAELAADRRRAAAAWVALRCPGSTRVSDRLRAADADGGEHAGRSPGAWPACASAFWVSRSVSSRSAPIAVVSRTCEPALVLRRDELLLELARRPAGAAA